MTLKITAEILLSGYAQGIFPMAENQDSPELHWINPQRRGVFPLDGFKISRSLRRRIRQENYSVSVNSAFNDVVSQCAGRRETWINAPLARLYDTLHQRGHAHSLEIWQDEVLTGGVFGITLGQAFFGESMFSKRRDASKIALAYLVDRLRQAGFSLFDTQFLTPHLASLGAIEIPRAAYRKRLADALTNTADFNAPGSPPDAQEMLQRTNHTS